MCYIYMYVHGVDGTGDTFRASYTGHVQKYIHTYKMGYALCIIACWNAEFMRYAVI